MKQVFEKEDISTIEYNVKNDDENNTQNYVRYVDLHAHLDGSITLDIAKKLANIQGIQLQAKTDKELEKLLTVPKECKSLVEFLNCFELPCSLLQTKKGISEAVYLVSEKMKSYGVVYAELRFAPQKHTDKGMTQEDSIIAALEGLKRTDLKVNLILCCMRGDNNQEENEETVQLASKYLVEDGGVVGIDLAGAESLYPTSNFEKLFEKANKLGIPFTIHAGEADGAQSVRCAVEYGARRIGHGVRMNEDEEVVELVKEKGIYLEMCPTSNSQTQAIKDMDSYPLKDYLDKGIKITINTDDMAIEGTNIANEFMYIENKFGLSAKQKKQLITNAIDAAFTTDEIKEKLKKEIRL